jgi:hypothetical protein
MTTGVYESNAVYLITKNPTPRGMGPRVRGDHGYELLHHLKQTGRAHAAADAHRHHDKFGLAAAALD